MSGPVLQVRDVGWQVAAGPVVLRTSRSTSARGVRRGHGPQRRRQEHAARHRRRPRGPRAAGRVTIAGRPLDEWTLGDARGSWRICRRCCAPICRSGRGLVLMGRYPHAIAGSSRRTTGGWSTRRCGDAAAWSSASGPCATLSGGERQRVLSGGVPRAGARVLLLDEPSTYLDIDQQLQCLRCCATRPTRARVPGGDARPQPGADVLHAASSCSRMRRVARDVPTEEPRRRRSELARRCSRRGSTRRRRGRPGVGRATGDGAS